MAKNNNLKDFLTGIANKLREYLYTTELINPQDFESKIAEAINTVGNNAYYSGIEEGKQAEYDKFWDSFQENGNKTNYLYAFSGSGWKREILKPKYKVYPIMANCIFQGLNSIDGNELTFDLTELDIELDFSRCTSMQQLFTDSYINHVGIIDARVSSRGINYTFFNATNLVTIDKIILKNEPYSSNPSSPFQGCSRLENVTIEGVIANNGYDLKNSTKLSKASITSIINALSATTNGLTVTINKTAKEAAFTTEEWATLIATKPNWNISLI